MYLNSFATCFITCGEVMLLNGLSRALTLRKGILSGTANGGQNFNDLINELAAFNPAPVAKDKTLKKGQI